MINAGLNLLLVIVFDMGVAGVAIGTIVSQMISSILVYDAFVDRKAVTNYHFQSFGSGESI